MNFIRIYPLIPSAENTSRLPPGLVALHDGRYGIISSCFYLSSMILLSTLRAELEDCMCVQRMYTSLYSPLLPIYQSYM